jgi:nitrate/nitrite-specific signal transduction histidine kinase
MRKQRRRQQLESITLIGLHLIRFDWSSFAPNLDGKLLQTLHHFLAHTFLNDKEKKKR